MLFVAYVDKNRCVGCRTCERYCPTGAVKVVNGKALVNPLMCLGCGICARFCPQLAIGFIPRYPASMPPFRPVTRYK